MLSHTRERFRFISTNCSETMRAEGGKTEKPAMKETKNERSTDAEDRLEAEWGSGNHRYGRLTGGGLRRRKKGR